VKISTIHLSYQNKHPKNWVFPLLLFVLAMVSGGYAQHYADKGSMPLGDYINNAANESDSNTKVMASLTFDNVQVCNGQYNREVRPYHIQPFPRNKNNVVMFPSQVLFTELCFYCLRLKPTL